MEKVQVLSDDLKTAHRELLQDLWKSFTSRRDNDDAKVNADMDSLCINEMFAGK